MPAIAIITVTPEMSTDAARRGGGGLERRPVRPSGGAFLTLALQVEERVVDADREPDEQEHGADVLVHRDEVARERDQADRGDDGREREQQRHARGDDRAEHERRMTRVSGTSRSPACASCSLNVFVERLARAASAGLADVEVGVRLRDLGGRGRDRVDLVGRDVLVALHVELDHRACRRPREIWPAWPASSGERTF